MISEYFAPVCAGGLVTIAEGKHPFPSRTRSLSPPAPTILQGQPCGTIGRCRSPRAQSRTNARDHSGRGRCCSRVGCLGRVRSDLNHYRQDHWMPLGALMQEFGQCIADLALDEREIGGAIAAVLTQHLEGAQYVGARSLQKIG
jgi:hypothetical protein